MRIVYFIGSLESGGKERRLVELISYLSKSASYEPLVVMVRNRIDYPFFHTLNCPFTVLATESFFDVILLPFRFLKTCRSFRPDLIHTWGYKYTFLAICTSILLHLPLLNSQITDAPLRETIGLLKMGISFVNFRFSSHNLANCYAGLSSYLPPKRKSSVIYNGVNLDRFENLPSADSIKKKYNILTNFMVIMVASFSSHKDYDTFVRIAGNVCDKRNDISFVCVGGSGEDNHYMQRVIDATKDNPLLVITGRVFEVEALINAADIGVLFSNKAVHGEGISNAILEYMALSKPVIANDTGGTKEIVKNGETGYLVKDESDQAIANIILDMIDNEKYRNVIGRNCRRLIESTFTIERMGKEFEDIYISMTN